MTSTAINLFIPIGLEDMDDYMDIAREADTAVGFFGAPGIGKTTKAYAYGRKRKELNPKAGLFFISGGSANVNDLQGYLMSSEKTYIAHDGEPVTLTQGEYTFPFWVFDIDTGMPIFMFEEAIIVLDEYPSMDVAEQKAFATPLLEKRVGLHKLPKGTRFIMLGNRFNDKSGVKKELAMMINRMVRYEVLAREDALMAHAIDKGWLPIIRAFIKKHHDIVLSNEVPEVLRPFCTPRSLDMCNANVKIALKRGWKFGEARMQTLMQGSIGTGPAKQLDTIARLVHTLPRPSAVKSDPKGTPIPDDVSARFLLAFELANYATPEDMQALTTYVRRMEKSFHVCFLSSALAKDNDLMGHPAVRDWLIDNMELMQACGDLRGKKG